MPNSPQQLPEEVFHAIAALIPRLMYIAEEECGLEPIDLLVLWHIRHFGVARTDRRNVILRGDLTEMLKKKFRFSDADVAKLLKGLLDMNLIERISISRTQRLDLFKEPDGQCMVVVLTQAGSDKLEEFKLKIVDRFGRWLLTIPSPLNRFMTRKVMLAAINFSRWFVGRFDPKRSEQLYGNQPNKVE